MTTTGGVSTFNPARDTIIRRALRMVGAYASTDNPRPEQITDALDVLNIMLKDWQMDGMLWLRSWETLFLNKGQRQYILAPSTYSGFSHSAVAANPGDTPYVQTTTTVAAAIADNHVHVTSATGMTSGDFIGVANDSGIIEWFYASVSGLVISLFSTTLLTAGTVTIGQTYLITDYVAGDDFTNIGAASNATGVSFTATGTTPTIWTYGSSVSLSSAISVAAALGNVVYSHTQASQGGRPTRITSAVRKLYDATAANGYEIPLEPPGGISRTDYERLPNKTTEGKIISYYYDPLLIAGILSVWPTADTPGDKLILTLDRSIQDMVGDTDTFDVPQEALKAISYNLALELEPEYPLDNAAFQKLSAMAIGSKLKLLNFNREITGTAFQPDMGRY